MAEESQQTHRATPPPAVAAVLAATRGRNLPPEDIFDLLLAAQAVEVRAERRAARARPSAPKMPAVRYSSDNPSPQRTTRRVRRQQLAELRTQHSWCTSAPVSGTTTPSSRSSVDLMPRSEPDSERESFDLTSELQRRLRLSEA
eukprot:m.291110 g.291110  ORF g.291110 m.291110 type:complete len:144 (+) comp12409_c0_seq1:161-592(+)